MRRDCLRAAGAALLACAVLAAPADAAERRDTTVTSFDGTQIKTFFFPAPALAAGERAPTVLSGHGWGMFGARSAETDLMGLGAIGGIGIADLQRAGYNVVTWDARGFGDSTGRAEIDSPDYEGRDVSAILDWLATQPDAELDGDGDPRMGMVGASYGGGIQFSAAAVDHRIDAIVPSIAWNTLERPLIPNGDLRMGWATGLLSIVRPFGINPVAPQAYKDVLRTGRVRQSDYDWFLTRGPGERVRDITAPTLILQGTADTLFPLAEGVANYQLLRQAGTPVKMAWFCGGHGLCTTNPGPSRTIGRATVDWLDRWVRERKQVDTGDGFSWLADDGQWRSAPEWPAPAGAPLTGDGRGRLGVRFGYSAGSGSAIGGAPAAGGVRVPVPVAGEADVVGAPKLTLTYKGTAWPRRDTHVFAQVVQAEGLGGGNVAGGQATPIPVQLDGRSRAVTVDLEMVSLHVRPGQRLEVQLIDSSAMFDPQRTSGRIDLQAHVELPTVTGARIASSEGPAPGGAL
ncbi:MAG: alpha/beta fold hydrolase [Solirubrobacteraceae bacterium]|nr:alpha/beta fold hydrolase [Solirubrobacteraceae bacterium]